MKKVKNLKNKLKSFEILLINDDKEFIGKKAAESDLKCNPDSCSLVDYSSCGPTRDECGIDLA